MALAALLAVGATGGAQAQTLNYSLFGAQNVAGTYTDLGTAGTVISTANTDDANSAATPIGFTFNYNGTDFTDFVLNTNGFLKLGTAAPTGPSYFPTAQATASTAAGPLTSTDTNLLLPLNEDLEAGTSPAEYRIAVTGTAPNRVATIQWKNVSDKARNNGAATPTLIGKQLTNISFQVKLYETTNQIEFVYGSATPGPVAGDNFKAFAVGIKGSGSTATQLITATKPSVSAWSATTFLAGNYTGNAHNVRSTVLPDAGRTYRFSPARPNDAATLLVYSLGKLPTPFGTPHVIQGLVRNVGTSALTNITVTASVTGANTFTNTKTIASLAVGATALVSFDPFSPTVNGTNNIAVSVGADDVASNNTATYTQLVNATTYAVAEPTAGSTGSVGFTANSGADAGTGIFLVRYTTNAPRRVSEVKVRLEGAPASVGRTVYGAVLDNAGTILARTPDYVITTADIGTDKTFTFATPVAVSGDFFAGMAQAAAPAGTAPYFPLGLQSETPTRANTFFTAALTGGAPTDAAGSNLGRFMIEAVTVAPATCAPPTAVTVTGITAGSATVNFTGPANGTSYTVVYGPTGFNPATGGTTVTPAPTASPVTLNGLSGSTTYQVYVRANCGANDQSTFAGPISFSTPCTPPQISTFPYNENFDAAAQAPCGYSILNVNGDANTWQVVATALHSASAPNAIAYQFNPNAAADDWFFTPQLLLRTTSRYQLSFKYKTQQLASFPTSERLEVKYGQGATVAAQTTTLFTNTNITNTTHVTATAPTVAVIQPATNGFYNIGFHVYSLADQYNLFIDDISITQVVTSASDALARAVAVFPNPSAGQLTVDVTNAQAKNGLQVEVINMVGQKVLSTSVRDNLSNKLDVSMLANGMYTLRVSNGAEYMIRTISIQK
ncbi:hypothetical protein GCM10023186_37280 [Hymenobacter koreensis]|uniref:Fibronectin type-III domain-containing protein n=1 Tax=Hymenobacter koreensis TaxID=1084523 RepID=A0ABP8JFC5_9BACT